METYACNPSTWESKAERTEVNAHLQLRSKFKVSLGYWRLCLKKTTTAKKQNHTPDKSCEGPLQVQAVATWHLEIQSIMTWHLLYFLRHVFILKVMWHLFMVLIPISQFLSLSSTFSGPQITADLQRGTESQPCPFSTGRHWITALPVPHQALCLLLLRFKGSLHFTYDFSRRVCTHLFHAVVWWLISHLEET